MIRLLSHIIHPPCSAITSNSHLHQGLAVVRLLVRTPFPFMLLRREVSKQHHRHCERYSQVDEVAQKMDVLLGIGNAKCRIHCAAL
jgi:hypothetical protein